MTILDIRVVPDPILKQVSKPVPGVDDDLRRLMDDMLETMYDAPGIGLAAIQVGVARMFLSSASGHAGSIAMSCANNLGGTVTMTWAASCVH